MPSHSETLPTVEREADANTPASNSGVGRATKKVRTRSDDAFAFDDPTVDRNGQTIPSEVQMASYKSTLLGSVAETASCGV